MGVVLQSDQETDKPWMTCKPEGIHMPDYAVIGKVAICPVSQAWNQSCLRYAERDFFQFKVGRSELATRRRYAVACAAARSFPCSISSTASEGAIQLFALTL